MSKTLETESPGTTPVTNELGSSDWAVNVELVQRERYTTGEEIAHGGIGRILRANDKRLERQVALKQLLDPSPEYEARFLREALVTAKLQHPAIVPVYDVGRFPDGEIFYAMKLVTGRSLGEIVDETKSIEERLALLPHVISVAEAMAYAHSERIVHRDLKPANVLVGPFGETVVIDWGIAKDLRELETPGESAAVPSENGFGGDASTSLTMAGAVLGTPGYMPPEQAAGEAVDERADVYALGAILYHVIAGVAPYDGKNGMDVLARVLTEPPPDLAVRERRVPRDLLAIVQKAMAREPERRYPTANEFAHDLRRFQTGQIVGAYHYSRRERAYRFVQRHQAAAAATALGLLLIGIIGLTSLARVLDARQVAEMERDRANEERARAEQKQSEAEAASRKAVQQSDELLLLEARNAARHDPNAALAWLSSLSDSFRRWGEARVIAADAQEFGIAKTLRVHTGPINMIAYSPDGSMLATASDDRRIGLWSPEGKLLRLLEGHTDEVWRLMFSDDNRQILSSSKDGTARLWNTSTGQSIHVFRSPKAEISWADFLDSTHVLALNCGQGRGRVELHNIENSDTEVLPGAADCPGAPTLTADRQTLVYSVEGQPRWLDLKTRKFRDYHDPVARCTMTLITPNYDYVACAGRKGYAGLWDAKSGRLMRSASPTSNPNYGSAHFSPDGRFFYYAQENQGYLHDLKTGKERAIGLHQGPTFIARFSHDSRSLVTTSYDRTAMVTDIETGNHRYYYGFRDTTSWADFSPSRPTVAIGSWDSTVRIFPLNASRNRIVKKGADAMRVARFTADERAIVSLENNGTVHVNQLEGANAAGTSKSLEGEWHILSHDATRVAYAEKTGTLHIHHVGSNGPDERLEGHTGPIELLSFSRNGDQLLSASADKTVRLWDLTTRQSKVLLEKSDGIISFGFSPDGLRVALGDRVGVTRVYKRSGQLEHTLTGHLNEVFALLFLPGNKQLVSGGQDHTLRIWDLETGKAHVIDASGLGIRQILASHDGKILYSLGTESSVRRWNTKNGSPLPILLGHRTAVVRMDLSPEESRLVTSGSNGDIRIWDLESGQSRLLEGHKGGVYRIFFSSQGDKFITAGEDGTTRLWYDDLPFDKAELRAWIEKASPDKGHTTPSVD